MSRIELAEALKRAAMALLDSDRDGRIELSDAPGAIENLARMAAVGERLTVTARDAFDALMAATRAGGVTENGRTLTAEDVRERWRQSKSGFSAAAQRAREESGGD